MRVGFLAGMLLLGAVPLLGSEPLKLFRLPSDPPPLSTAEAALTFWFRLYQHFITPANGPTCTFTPTCSAYAYQAVRRYGLVGVLMGVERLMRSHAPSPHYTLRWRGGRLTLGDPPENHAPDWDPFAHPRFRLRVR